MRSLLVLLAAWFSALSLIADPLPAWRDTATKEAIIGFVEKVTKDGSPDFVPEPERIAVFDNDGTLWSEQPFYFQVAYIVDTLRARAETRPEWKEKEPFASVLKDGEAAMGKMSSAQIVEIIAASQEGMTVEEFNQSVKKWIASARHPSTKRLYTEMVFQPMLELLSYLRTKGFKTYIVTGGGVDFVRAWAERVYGIPPEQVIGSYGRYRYEEREGNPAIFKLPELILNDNEGGKPVGIQTFIGRRPIFAFGNSDGDCAMLEWTTTGPGARLGLLVHHDDAKREWAYDRDSSIGTLSKGLDEAKKKGWIITSMKNDWATIYPPLKK